MSCARVAVRKTDAKMSAMGVIRSMLGERRGTGGSLWFWIGCKVGNEGRGKAEAQRQHKAGCVGWQPVKFGLARPHLFGNPIEAQHVTAVTRRSAPSTSPVKLPNTNTRPVPNLGPMSVSCMLYLHIAISNFGIHPECPSSLYLVLLTRPGPVQNHCILILPCFILFFFRCERPLSANIGQRQKPSQMLGKVSLMRQCSFTNACRLCTIMPRRISPTVSNDTVQSLPRNPTLHR